MTNHRAKPTGWTDLDVADGVFQAVHVNTIDRGIAGSIDVSVGGIYSPAQELRIDDLGTSALLDSYLRGTQDRSASGRVRPRVDFATLADVAPSQKIDTTFDAWWSDSAFSQAWDILLVTTESGGQMPSTNDTMEVSITSAGTGFAVTISQESPLLLLATFPAARVIQPANTPMYAKFAFVGAAWRLIDASADVV